jgi:arylsulfatase A-like enzyme
MAHLGEAEVQAPAPAYVKADELVFVAGERRFSLFAHAPSQITFNSVPVYADGQLTFGIGLHRDAWDRVGDGVNFVLEVVDGEGATHRLYERWLDPHSTPADRAWFDESIDLNRFAGQQVQIVFRTEAGTNNQNDWAAWSDPVLVSWEEASEPPEESPNVLLITIDTLRADHVSSYGYPRNTTPILDCLANEGVRFSHAYSHSDHTNPSHLSMLTGLYPRSHGIANNHTRIPLELVTIPERLQALGYHTVGAVSAFHLGPVLNMDQGFEDFFPTDQERRLGGTTTEIVQEWLIEKRQQPFFMWVHYFDPHAPYLPPHPYDILYDAGPTYAPFRLPMADLQMPENWPQRYGDWPASAEDVAEIIAQYDGAIRYTDTQVGQLLETLRNLDLLDNTIVIVTSDHGEGFGEHGVAFDHYGLHEETVHVPLIVWAPGRLSPGQVVEELVGHVDLGPTLYELLGFSVPQDLQGISLVPALQGQRWHGYKGIVSQQHDSLSQSVRTAEWRLILQQQDDEVWPLYPLQAGQLELYNQEEDPKEASNRWPAGSRAAERALEQLSQQLLEWEAATPRSSFSQAPPLDEETEEMLRRLGY